MAVLLSSLSVPERKRTVRGTPLTASPCPTTATSGTPSVSSAFILHQCATSKGFFSNLFRVEDSMFLKKISKEETERSLS